MDIEKFEKWVKGNYAGRNMDSAPEDFDIDSELYYRIEDLHYGPIKFDEIPLEFRNG